METFFKKNTEIQEWVDLLIEKLLTVCLLGSSDSDSEFFQGRQAAEKIACILESITNLPEDTLKEGIRQLVEQRLPDPRVIDNFPQFYNFMEAMIQSGISILPSTEPVPNLPGSTPFTGVPSSKIVLTRGPETAENSPPVYIPEVIITDTEDNVALNVFAPLSSFPLPVPLIPPVSSIPLLPDAPPIPFKPQARALVPEALKVASDRSEATLNNSGSEQCPEPELPLSFSSQFPAEGERLSRVLRQLYPKEQPCWNVMIGHYSILAQVSNLLIYIPKDEASRAEASNAIKSDLKEDWHVVICQQEDLAYPRRLERAIRQTLRETVYFNRPSSFL